MTRCHRLLTMERLRASPLALGAVAALMTCEPACAQSIEEIVVTATRRPVPALRTPLSIGRVDTGAIVLVGSTHHAEILNRVPGVMIQRGSGQESLTAIRSPVLTGAGSCGAFLFLENGLPIRPTGFCNVNELFEINTEQAASVEVLRGPGTALYGSNSMHGTVNVLQPMPAGRPIAQVGMDVGPDDYGRLKLAGRHERGEFALGAAALYTHDGGWRDDSSFDEAKANLTSTSRWRDVPVRMDLAATWLDQDTAGFVTGKNVYRDEDASRANANPEAFREAHAVRLSGLIEPPAMDTARLELRPFLRTSRMDFLQHFLLGKPLERNGQESGGLSASLAWDTTPDWSVVTGLDLELADSFLVEDQANPTIGGPPAANAIRPVGLHYDYAVHSSVAALYASTERSFLGRWRVAAGLRAEYVAYDYDNRMLAGNTDENGVPCSPAGCLYSRPADRTDTFVNVAPKLNLSVDLLPRVVAYASGSRGFRPPEMTELYRLQRAQAVADLDSEQLDAFELGVKGAWERFDGSLAWFTMDKSDVILRESNGFNVDNGRTSHRGIEYELRWRVTPGLDLSVAGTHALHRYEFSRTVDGGETILNGNDVDTAPRDLGRAGLDWRPSDGLEFEAEWLVVGEYWLDATNQHRYGGHGLLNLRGRWDLARGVRFALRLNNALDRRYADRADYAFGTYRYFPGRPRSLFAEITWTR